MLTPKPAAAQIELQLQNASATSAMIGGLAQSEAGAENFFAWRPCRNPSPNHLVRTRMTYWSSLLFFASKIKGGRADGIGIGPRCLA
jgi:hypothetical protein